MTVTTAPAWRGRTAMTASAVSRAGSQPHPWSAEPGGGMQPRRWFPERLTAIHPAIAPTPFGITPAIHPML